MRRLIALLLVVAATTAARGGEFEGIADSKLTMRRENGGPSTATGRTFISKAALRTEMEMQSPELQKATGRAAMRMTWLQRFSEPGIVYSINDERKAYSVLDTTAFAKDAKSPPEKFTVTKLGTDTIAGHRCEKFLAVSERGRQVELCTAKDVVGSSAWLAAMERSSSRGPGWMPALREAGADGLPLRMITRDPGSTEPRVTMEVLRLEEKALAASLFEIPAGYTKADFFGAESLSPEQEQQLRGAQQKMNEAMEGMSPEQRKAIEEMMRKMGGARPPH
ncbi:MAG: DUF4412 domain-containing protein [Candidatus Binatia bacterium]